MSIISTEISQSFILLNLYLFKSSFLGQNYTIKDERNPSIMTWIATQVIVVLLLIVCLETPGLWRERKLGELTLFLVLMCGFGSLGVMEALQFALPNPLDWLNTLFEPLNKVILSVLE
jgi:hypothetical protein